MTQDEGEPPEVSEKFFFTRAEADDFVDISA